MGGKGEGAGPGGKACFENQAFLPGDIGRYFFFFLAFFFAAMKITPDPVGSLVHWK